VVSVLRRAVTLGAAGLAAALLIGGCGSAAHQAQPPRPPAVPGAPRTLVVLLDAVPFESVAGIPLAGFARGL
jgi:hypothetical protein